MILTTVIPHPKPHDPEDVTIAVRWSNGQETTHRVAPEVLARLTEETP